MNSPVIMFSNDNFPVLMAFSSVFLFFIFMFAVEGRGREPAVRHSCGIRAVHDACAGAARPGGADPAFLLPAIRLQIIRRSASAAAST